MWRTKHFNEVRLPLISAADMVNVVVPSAPRPGDFGVSLLGLGFTKP